METTTKREGRAQTTKRRSPPTKRALPRKRAPPAKKRAPASKIMSASKLKPPSRLHPVAVRTLPLLPPSPLPTPSQPRSMGVSLPLWGRLRRCPLVPSWWTSKTNTTRFSNTANQTFCTGVGSNRNGTNFPTTHPITSTPLLARVLCCPLRYINPGLAILKGRTKATKIHHPRDERDDLERWRGRMYG